MGYLLTIDSIGPAIGGTTGRSRCSAAPGSRGRAARCKRSPNASPPTGSCRRATRPRGSTRASRDGRSSAPGASPRLSRPAGHTAATRRASRVATTCAYGTASARSGHERPDSASRSRRSGSPRRLFLIGPPWTSSERGLGGADGGDPRRLCGIRGAVPRPVPAGPHGRRGPRALVAGLARGASSRGGRSSRGTGIVRASSSTSPSPWAAAPRAPRGRRDRRDGAGRGYRPDGGRCVQLDGCVPHADDRRDRRDDGVVRREARPNRELQAAREESPGWRCHEERRESRATSTISSATPLRPRGEDRAGRAARRPRSRAARGELEEVRRSRARRSRRCARRCSSTDDSPSRMHSTGRGRRLRTLGSSAHRGARGGYGPTRSRTFSRGRARGDDERRPPQRCAKSPR